MAEPAHPRGPGVRLTLLTSAELHELLGGEDAPLVLQAGSAQPPDRPVIPSAVLVSLSEVDTYLDDERGEPLRVSQNYSLKPDAELRAALEAMGVTHTRQVVVYTQCIKLGNVDVAVAARLAWCLAYAGVERVSLLAGGTGAWEKAGFALSAAPAQRQPAADFFAGAALPFPRNPQYLASTDEVAVAVELSTGCPTRDGGCQLADVRSWREYTGAAHDYPYEVPLGRIPTSHWAHWGPSTYVGGDFFVNATGELLPLAGTARLWEQWGLDLGPLSRRRAIFYCGSGWRSAVAWCVAQLIGHADCANYDGGFLEWALLDERAAERPVVCGVPTSVRPGPPETWPVCACRQPHPPFAAPHVAPPPA
jgi:3-mercaptopyruvate sulfurtransferase SseA